MKKFLSVLLSLLMLCQPIVFAETVTENVALDKAAFSYNSADGTAPSLAVDGDYGTEWISQGPGALGGLSDNFVIDLGAECSLESIDIISAVEASIDNITVYGANDVDNTTVKNIKIAATDLYENGEAAETTKPYKDWKKTQLGTTGTTGADELTLAVSGSYRYIILEQASGVMDNMGFAEIVVNGEATEDSSEAAGAVTMLNSSSTVYSFNGHVGGSTSNAALLQDTNPSTFNMQIGNTNSKKGVQVFMDLGASNESVVTHVAYQATAYDATTVADSRYLRSIGEFQIVGSDSLDGPFTEIGYAGSPDISVKKDDKDIGLWIIPVDSNDTAYRYIGLRKVGSSYSTTFYWNINTFQAYTSTASVEETVAQSGKDYIVNTQASVVSESELSYEASVLNGSKNGDVLGLFVGKNSSGATVTALAEGTIALKGANNTLTLSALIPDGVNPADYTWSMTVVHKNTMTVMDFISDVKTLTNPGYGVREGETATAEYSRVVNELKLSGTADADVIGMIILKPYCDFDTFMADDIFAFDVRTLDSTGPYSFSNLMQGAESGKYKVGFFANTDTFEAVDAISHEVVDVEEVAAVFDSATADTLMDIFTEEEYAEIQSLFDKSLVDTLIATDAQTGTVGKSFLLAKAGFEDGVFADSEGWSDMDIISKAIQTALLVDNTLTGTDIADSVDTYGDTMPLIFESENNKKYYDADEFEEILPYVISEVKPDTAEELALSYERAIALCLIADGELLDRKTALEIYSDELGIKESTLKTSHTLRAIADELSSGMGTVKSSYAGGMDKAVENIIDELDDRKSGGNSGGSGGGGITLGGNKTGVKAETPAYTAPVVTAPAASEQAPQDKLTFNDISGYEWAKDSIELLAGRNILAGVGDGSFNPSGLLTREQAVKLLVLTLNMDTNQNTNSFKDLEYGAWYYPYITSAKMSGLVTGISRTEFGLGQLVTRQDMAVMIYRALDARKLATASEGMTFADDAYVADYAKEAVASLGSMGLITGYTDGRFGPGDTATRAEAAAVFARLLKIVENANKEAAQ